MAQAFNQSVKTPYRGLSPQAFDFWGRPVLKDSKGILTCPGYTGDTYLTNPWDTMLIGVEGPLEQNEQPQTPGKCTVSVKKGRALDTKKPAGSDGETVTFHGITCARVDLQIMIWTPQQLLMLEKLWAKISPPAGKGDPSAFDVLYPSLRRLGIKSLQFYEAEGPGESSLQLRVFLIHAVEFLKPSKKSVTHTDEKSISSAIDPKVTPKPGTNSKNTGPT